MKCRVDTHTALGYGDYANQTKIGFFTWGNNISNSREVMSILGNGNVGIGTTSPGCILDVALQHGDTSSPMVHFRANPDGASQGDGNVLKLENSGNRTDVELLECVSSGTTRFVVKAGGNVGIGTSSPAQKLHVAGNIAVTAGNSILIGTSTIADNQNGGINWHVTNNEYYIRRTAGTWVSPNYQQLEINWPTGIVMKPGSAYGKSYVDIQGRIVVNGTTMSKAPRVIHIDDHRSGCPPGQAANTPIMQYSLVLARSAYVFVSVTTILIHSSRADCQILFGSSIQQNHLTASDNTSWNPVCMTAGGTIAAGTTNIVFRSTTANVVGCQSDWGGMQILVFEQ